MSFSKSFRVGPTVLCGADISYFNFASENCAYEAGFLIHDGNAVFALGSVPFLTFINTSRLAHKSLLWGFLRQWMSAYYNSLEFALSVEVETYVRDPSSFASQVPRF